MYRTDLATRDKGGALAAVLLIHAGLLFVLLHLSGTIDLSQPQEILKTFDVNQPLPPPAPPRTQPSDKPKPKEKEGGSAPKNVKSEATPIKAPKPRVEPQIPNPVVVAETPRQGASPTQGASDVRGPGTGSGGLGNGTGSGMGGNGPGGGGGGGSPAALVRGITGRDYPPQVREAWPRGAAIFLRLRIEPNGRASQCDVMRGFGNPDADRWTCALIVQRGVFRPARDSFGRPVSAWFGYKQSDRDR